MNTLRFLKPEFRKGLNYTVRLGDKWRHTDINEMVWIETTGIGKSINAVAQIQRVIYCRLAELPQEVLDKEHDPECHTWEGLLRAMQAAYPDDFKDKDGEEIECLPVTCMGFYIWYANGRE